MVLQLLLAHNFFGLSVFEERRNRHMLRCRIIGGICILLFVLLVVLGIKRRISWILGKESASEGFSTKRIAVFLLTVGLMNILLSDAPNYDNELNGILCAFVILLFMGAIKCYFWSRTYAVRNNWEDVALYDMAMKPLAMRLGPYMTAIGLGLLFYLFEVDF